MAMSMIGRINGYKCRECGGVTMTKDVDEGTTSMFIGCRIPSGCKGTAVSMMYPTQPMPPELDDLPVWEWYKPKSDDPILKAIGMTDYVERGGLVLREPTEWASDE